MIAFVWLIASILTFIVKMTTTLSGLSIFNPYIFIFIISSVIVIYFTTELVEKIYNKLKNFFTLSNKDKIIIFFKFILILILIILLSEIILLPIIIQKIILIINSYITYLLTGSYSIEEVSIDNPDMLTFIMKEKGVSYDVINVSLLKLNPYEPTMSDNSFTDNITMSKNNDISKPSRNLWVKSFNYGWIINIINVSDLPSGTYRLQAGVYEDKNNVEPIIGSSKKNAFKIFYIPTNRTNCSVNDIK